MFVLCWHVKRPLFKYLSDRRGKNKLHRLVYKCFSVNALLMHLYCINHILCNRIRIFNSTLHLLVRRIKYVYTSCANAQSCTIIRNQKYTTNVIQNNSTYCCPASHIQTHITSKTCPLKYTRKSMINLNSILHQ